MNRTDRIGRTRYGIALAIGLLMLSTFIASATAVPDVPHSPAPPQHDSLKCEIHHVGLVEENMHIAYGLPAFNEQAMAAMRVQDSLFPHAVPYLLGGCVIDENSPKSRIIHYCPICRVARDAWLKGYEAGAHPEEDR